MKQQTDPRFIQGTPEWHALRKTKVTATDARSIAGVDPWKSILTIWKEKQEDEVSTYDNESMRRGREIEPQALEILEDLTGHLMTPKVVLHPTIGFMMASLDAMEISGNAIGEFKSHLVGSKDYECAMDGEVPAIYYPQLQHQMEVVKLPRSYYLSCLTEKDIFSGKYYIKSYKLLEVHFDEKYVENLLKEEAEFWQCVLTKTEPKSKKNFTQMTSKEWTDAATKYKEIGKQISFLEDQRRAYKDSLLAMADGQQAQGGGVTLSKIVRKGRVDVDSLARDAKLDPEKYREPSKEEWRLT